MPRPHFTTRMLLWLTLVVAALLGGMAVQKVRDMPNGWGRESYGRGADKLAIDYIRLGGAEWYRVTPSGSWEFETEPNSDGDGTFRSLMRLPDGSRWLRIEEAKPDSRHCRRWDWCGSLGR